MIITEARPVLCILGFDLATVCASSDKRAVAELVDWSTNASHERFSDNRIYPAGSQLAVQYAYLWDKTWPI